MYPITHRVNEIVRTVWKHTELGRNVLVAAIFAAVTILEGQAFTYASGGAYQPVETRRANRTQIFIKTWKVSGTIEGVGKYGRDSEWALRKLHAMFNFVLSQRNLN